MKTEKKKTLRGSILFTVVCVMALLIIFLTGTLALASAAGNRAHRSYSVSQANYTARAAIASFTEAMKRDERIVAAVQAVGSDPSVPALHPQVIINDKTLGEIGYIDSHGDWIKDHIEVTHVPNTGAYDYYDKKGDGNYGWYPVDTVKITATCKVGKERETVSAYVQKAPSSQTVTNGGGIQGLQEVGGNSFANGALITGGLGVGIGDTVPGLHHFHNGSKVETTLTYVNASLCGGTSDFEIRVKKPDRPTAEKPYSQTVIDGNLLMENNSFVVLNYEMTEDYTQKEVPYLFINGMLTQDQSSDLNLVRGNNAPFNVFIGTLNPMGPVNIQGDLYLMDKNPHDPSQDYTAEYMDRDGNRNPSKDVTGTKGVNYFGRPGKGGQLYAWVTSAVQKQETQFGSTGGNIYCMGDLNLSQATVRGDVRVEGDCKVDDNVTIQGDLVVHGNLTINENKLKDIVKGEIYYGAGGGRTLKAGFSYHENEVYPDITVKDNYIFDNTPVPESEGEYYKTLITQEGEGIDDLTTIVNASQTKYKVDFDGKPLFERDEEGNFITDSEGRVVGITSESDHTYYDADKNEVEERDAKGTYYSKEGDTKRYTEDEAYEGQAKYKSYASYNQPAYPTKMQREYIWGEKDESGVFTVKHPETKIIKTLHEVREALNYDDEGNYKTDIYHTSVPDDFLPVSGDQDSLPYAYINGARNGSDQLWSGGAITKSCIISNKENPTQQLTITEDIHIKPLSEMWVVIKNINSNNHKIIVDRDATANGKVNFLIVGKNNRLENTSIITSEVYNNMPVKYDKEWGIEYYAAPNAELQLYNNCTLVGTFKAPELIIGCDNQGAYTIQYEDEYGHTDPKTPVVLGSALVQKVTRAVNNFSVINSGNGGVGSGGSNIDTALGRFEIKYLMGV